MKLENQVVSLELAKNLKELGVKQESLFFYATLPNENKYRLYPLCVDPQESDEVKLDNKEKEYSAFTVAELGEMLPAGALGAHLNIFKNVDKGWNVGYGLEVTLTADTEADARAKCLIYLIENGLIKA